MKCHYEILNIPQDADLPEIKSSYKKLALRWHPDKNLNDPEAAKEQFQLVQQAYEILSDPQERAWYDKHREQILRGSNSDYEDNCLDLFQYFTTTCFKGYGDDEKGFYTVYRNVFNKIIEEDSEFIRDKEEFEDIPRFGDSKSDYDEVVGPFYNYWQSYSTKKSYVWLDLHNIKDARDRRVFKLMEKENKKVRQQAKKERNEEIRNLVAFVRKRDKRVQERQKLLEEKIQENRQKQLNISKQKRLERQRELGNANEAEWAKFGNFESELLEIEKNLAREFGEEDSDEDSEIDDLYCVACDKFFKTPKALQNHESSKKHKEFVKILKSAMIDDENEEIGEEEIVDSEESEKEETEDTKKKRTENVIKAEDDEDFEEEEEITNRRKKKSKNVIKVEDDEDSEHLINIIVENGSEEEPEKSKNKKKKKTKNSNRIVEENKSSNEHDLENNLDNSSDLSTSTKKNKKAKKTQDKTKNKKSNKYEETDVDLNHCCANCKTEFPSKNKLFDHLKKTGHGVYLPTKVKNKQKKTD